MLSNHGIFFLVLEMSLCDPLLSPTGLKHLKQLMLGPPVDCVPLVESDQLSEEVYISSVAEALAELYFQSPMLQLVALLLPGVVQPVQSRDNTHASIRDKWCELNEDNQAEVVAGMTSPGLHSCVMLKTRCETWDNGSKSACCASSHVCSVQARTFSSFTAA